MTAGWPWIYFVNCFCQWSHAIYVIYVKTTNELMTVYTCNQTQIEANHMMVRRKTLIFMEKDSHTSCASIPTPPLSLYSFIWCFLVIHAIFFICMVKINQTVAILFLQSINDSTIYFCLCAVFSDGSLFSSFRLE